MDLIVNKIVIRENDMQWDPADDTEFVAFFCNRDCLLAYIIDNYYVTEGGTYEEVSRAIAAYLAIHTDNEPSSPNSN